jgi:hypothetical protein
VELLYKEECRGTWRISEGGLGGRLEKSGRRLERDIGGCLREDPRSWKKLGRSARRLEGV